MKKAEHRLLRNKQGVVLEYGILAMLTLFGFCTLLTLSTLLLKKDSENYQERLIQKNAVMQIAEDFIYAVKTGEVTLSNVDSYVCDDENYRVSAQSHENINYRFTVTNKQTGETLLEYLISSKGAVIKQKAGDDSIG